jgi:hypothetical protein
MKERKITNTVDLGIPGLFMLSTEPRKRVSVDHVLGQVLLTHTIERKGPFSMVQPHALIQLIAVRSKLMTSSNVFFFVSFFSSK